MKKISTPILFILQLIILSTNISCEEKEDTTEEFVEEYTKFWETYPGSKLEDALSIAGFYEEMDDLQKATFGHILFAELSKLQWQAINDSRLTKDLYEYIDFSIQYYLRIKDSMRAIECYGYKGQMLLEKRKYPEASKVFLETMDIKDKENYPSQLGKVYFYMGRVSGFQDQFTDALKYMDLAIHYLEKVSLDSEIAKIYMTKGWIYEVIKDYQSAIELYHKALELTTDPAITGELFNSIGSSYAYINKLDSAYHYTSESLEYPYTETNFSKRLYFMAEVYYKLHRIDSALIYAHKAFEYPIDIYFEKNLYDLLREIAVQQEDNEKITYYTKQYQTSLDSVRKISSQPGLSVVQQIHELDKITLEMKSHRFYLSLFLILISSIAIVIIFFLFYKHRSKKQEADAYKTELEEKEELLDQHHTKLEKRHEMLLLNLEDEIKRTKEKYAVKRAKSSFQERMEIDRIIYYEVFNLGNEKAFTIKMNHILNRFPDKLKETYPDISYKEIIWCCLFMLRIPTNDMCIILEYKQTSLYKFKQRLMKKLGFHGVKEFETMLYEIMNK